MQGCKQGYMNQKIRGHKDESIPTSLHEPENMRMQGCEDTSKHT